MRARTDEQVVALLLLRPDLSRPAPSDLTSLAARATTRASVQRCLESLDRGLLQVLEAVVVAAAEVDGVSTQAVMTLLDTGDGSVTRERVEQALSLLWSLAVVWRAPEGLRLVRSVPEALAGRVAGLGPSYGDLTGRQAPPQHWIERTVGEASPSARWVLDQLTWGPPLGVLGRDALDGTDGTDGTGAQAAQWLVDHSLVVALDELRGRTAPMPAEVRVVLPREVALALRGGHLFKRVELDPPAAREDPVGVEQSDLASGGSVSDLLALADDLTQLWGPEPPRVLRSGGLAVRDLKRTADALDVPVRQAAWLVELMHAAGLVADDGDLVPVWAPTAGVDDWLGQPAGRRWATLAAAWLASTRAAHFVGEKAPGASSSANALGPDVHWPPVRAIRADVLDELASLPEGTATSVASVLERLAWRRPLRARTRLDDAVPAVLREAEWLGVTGRGALSSAGRRLASGAGAEELAASMDGQLPDPVDHILLQGDLTAIAPGPLQGGLARLMRLVSDVESRGGATVHRFSPASVRRALDAGWTADEVLDELGRASRTGVPQPLDYLVRDIARRHGQLRIGGATAYIRADDEAGLEAMVADRRLAMLGLRRIAPTVLVSQADPAVVVEALRDNGFAPVLERPDGSVVVEVAARRRSAGRRASPRPVVSALDDSAASGLVARLRAGEEVTAARRAAEAAGEPVLEATEPVVTIAALQDAAADGRGVWIGYVDLSGRTERHLFYPTRVEGGRAYGRIPDGASERAFAIQRITGVAST